MSQPANNPTAPLSLTALWTMTPQEDITTLTTRCGVHILVGVWVWKVFRRRSPCNHDLWCVVYGVWCVVCGVWCVVCGAWCVYCVVLCAYVLLSVSHPHNNDTTR